MQPSRIPQLSRATIVKALTFTFGALTLTMFSAGAFASGGTNSGGVNSGGGGGGGGGGTTTSPSPTPPPVLGTFTSFKPVAGYTPAGITATAIWTSYSVQTYNNATPHVRLTIVNPATGEVYWNAMYTMFGATIDDDYLPFNTTFVVTVELYDASGNLLDSRSATVTTPPVKDTTAG